VIATDIRRAKERADEARSAFHQAVRYAHAEGMTMRAIAHAAGISHQRVHQILHGK